MATAIFSPCKKYRYTLSRTFIGDMAIIEKYGKLDLDLIPYVNFVLLNPSTADDTRDDPTVRRCINWAQAWGYERLIVTNLFAYRSTNPMNLYEVEDPVGPENDRYILDTALMADKIVVGWGLHGKLHGRSNWFRKRVDVPMHVLRLTKNEPWHPLYLPNNSQPILWERNGE